MSIAVPGFRWRLALEFLSNLRGAETAQRSVATVRYGCSKSRSAAGSSRKRPRQAALHFAAAFPAIPRPSVGPDFRWSGIRTSGLGLTLAGTTDRSAGSARRARSAEGHRPEVGLHVSRHAVCAGIVRAIRRRWAGGRDIQVSCTESGAVSPGERAPKHA